MGLNRTDVVFKLKTLDEPGYISNLKQSVWVSLIPQGFAEIVVLGVNKFYFAINTNRKKLHKAWKISSVSNIYATAFKYKIKVTLVCWISILTRCIACISMPCDIIDVLDIQMIYIAVKGLIDVTHFLFDVTWNIQYHYLKIF